MRKLLDSMLSRDIIEPSHGPWASPVVLVKKKDGSIRFCVDFRKVNDCTQKDAQLSQELMTHWMPLGVHTISLH